jgi:hypothetical protein
VAAKSVAETPQRGLLFDQRRKRKSLSLAAGLTHIASEQGRASGDSGRIGYVICQCEQGRQHPDVLTSPTLVGVSSRDL